jgi:hypothetical protein
METKNRTALCCLLLFMLQRTICPAQQEPPIEIPSISFGANMVLPGFPIGRGIDISVDSRDLQRAGGVGQLHGRVFRGSMQDLKTRFRYLTGDGCLLYLAGIYPVGKSARGIKILVAEGGPALTLTIDWLSRARENAGGNQSFVLVLEKKSAARGLLKIWPLKIRPQDAESYFSNGLEFIVKSNRLLQRDEERRLLELHERNLAESMEVAKAVTGSRTGSHTGCRTYSKIEIAGSAFLMSDSCPEDVFALRLGEGPLDMESLLVAP